MKTTGNTILITGGTAGIGYGLARRFHDAGNKVIVAGRRQELLDQITTEHPGIDAIALDVADPDSITRSAETLATSRPELNVLINNAGIMQTENVMDPTDIRIAEDIVTTNLLGTIRMTYAFLPQLAAQDDAAVMNVTSALAFMPMPITPTYCATKAALHSFTMNLRTQLADTAVEVIEVIPPAVQTTLLGQQDDENAMPLEDYLSETMALLNGQPAAKEIVVERVKFLRHAEAEGRYEHAAAILSGVGA
jgi:uncharacterized oxidoreductase